MRTKSFIFSVILVCGISLSGLAQRGETPILYTEAGQLDRLVQLYPNPATEFLSVKLPTPTVASAKLAMHSVIGNVIEMEREPIDDYEVRIRVRDLPSGYYFLSIKDEESGLRATYKFLKR